MFRWPREELIMMTPQGHRQLCITAVGVIQQAFPCCKVWLSGKPANNGEKSMAYSEGQDENPCSRMDGCFLWLKPASRKDDFFYYYSPEPEWKIILIAAYYDYKTLTWTVVVHQQDYICPFDTIFIGSIALWADKPNEASVSTPFQPVRGSVPTHAWSSSILARLLFIYYPSFS